MSNKLGQLGLDYIFSNDGERIRRLPRFSIVEIGADQYRFKIDSMRLPHGINELEMTQEDVIKGVEATIGKTISYHLGPEGLWYYIDRESGLHNIPRFIRFKDAYNALSSKDDALTICVGMSAGRMPVKISLTADTTAHFLIGGSTGTGKTNLIHTIICSLLKRDPAEVQLMLVDLKRIEMTCYEGVPHLAMPIIYNPPDVLPIIEELWKEIERRLALMHSSGENNIKKYNHCRKHDRLAYRVCIFDELAICMLDRTLGKKAQIESVLARIASVGRAAGVHLILATQRPEKAVLTSLITANFPGRIALACASVYDSMTIIGNGDACFADQNGTPAGRAVVAYGRFRKPMQCAYLKDSLRQEIIADAKAGKYGVIPVHHDVTIQELAKYALENFAGQYKTMALYKQFNHRGITVDEIKKLSYFYREAGHFFTLDDVDYVLVQYAKRKQIYIIKKENEPVDGK